MLTTAAAAPAPRSRHPRAARATRTARAGLCARLTRATSTPVATAAATAVSLAVVVAIAVGCTSAPVDDPGAGTFSVGDVAPGPAEHRPSPLTAVPADTLTNDATTGEASDDAVADARPFDSIATDEPVDLTPAPGTDETDSVDRGRAQAVDELDGPERAAAGVVLDGLAAEGLFVTSIDTELLAVEDRQATVAVVVAHSPGHGHPTQSRYEIDLIRDVDGWQLAGHREPR